MPIRAFGRFSIQIGDPEKVARRMAHADDDADDGAMTRLRRMVAGRFSSALQALEWQTLDDLIDGLNDLDGLVDTLFPPLVAGFQGLGLRLLEFTIENLTGPDALALAPKSRASDQMRDVGRQILEREVGGDADTQEDELPIIIADLDGVRVHVSPSDADDQAHTFDAADTSQGEDSEAEPAQANPADSRIRTDPYVPTRTPHNPPAETVAGPASEDAPLQATPSTVRRVSQPLPVGRPDQPAVHVQSKPTPSVWKDFRPMVLEETVAPHSGAERALLDPTSEAETVVLHEDDAADPCDAGTSSTPPAASGLSCSRCGSAIPQRGKFCPTCGEEQSMP